MQMTNAEFSANGEHGEEAKCQILFWKNTVTLVRHLLWLEKSSDRYDSHTGDRQRKYCSKA
jgi:hypothetical protein